MYELKEWSPSLDLTEFYQEAQRRGHTNNASEESMVGCFKDEEKFQVWILYKNNRAIGSVAAHTFTDMGIDSYRILARTCVIDGVIPNGGTGLGTGRRYIQEHQNITCQFFIPKMIEWCGENSNMYATSNQLSSGSQKQVHNIYFPLLERQGEFTKQDEIYYRGAMQTPWKLNTQVFLKNLNLHPRWV